MSSRPYLLTALFLSSALTACAGLDTRLPEITAPDLAAETQYQETEALRKIEIDAGVLLNAGWPVLTANSELCPKVRAAIGVKTHSLKSYPKRLRSAAGQVLGADETARIFHIADGSPAALAGFKRGDVILNDAGEPAKLDGDSWDSVLADNTVNIRRGSENIAIKVEPVSACDYNLQLRNSAVINAYADGRNITITSGMMEFTQSDSELALIIGHELAHNSMGHIRKSIGNYIISFGGTRYTRPFESEADYVGLYYMVRAGYSPEGVEGFWQRLAKVSPKGINRAKTHPTFPDRYLRIRAAREEILAKQKSGAALLPNFISGDDPSGS
ncbi:MAG: M48 family metallopeptidase [Litorimonas sp.]